MLSPEELVEVLERARELAGLRFVQGRYCENNAGQLMYYRGHGPDVHRYYDVLGALHAALLEWGALADEEEAREPLERVVAVMWPEEWASCTRRSGLFALERWVDAPERTAEDVECAYIAAMALVLAREMGRSLTGTLRAAFAGPVAA